MLRAGDEFDPGIRDELERADIILLLVSPDFIASSYCYDVEMTRALERHRAGEARVIPVILRACDWHPTPFGKLMAAPRDGKPVRSWPDLDDAFLDVAKKIREALPQAAPARSAPVAASHSIPLASLGPRSSNLRINKTFTDADRDRFLNEAFDFMAKFFEGSLSELKMRNPEIDTAFKRIDANRFTAVIYRNGKAVSRCKIMLGGMLGRGISYSSNDQASDNSCNESLSVETDPHGMFLSPMMGMLHFAGGREKQHLTFEGAAEYYWGALMKDLQRE